MKNNNNYILIGIDDTDNPNTRGTGFQSREMAKLIHKSGLGRVKSITRHQLFFDRRIPYTSQNSSACLLIESDKIQELTKLCRKFLLEIAADCSDVGLAVGKIEDVDTDIIDWGYKAKSEVLTKENAYKLAKIKGIMLEGLTGTKDGIIGALAAIGLRKFGNDGRCIWLDGFEIRDLKGIYTAEELYNLLYIDDIIDLNNKQIDIKSKINVGEWVRPAIRKNKITIFVSSKNNENYEFEVASKEYIKSISD
ncbi:MAG: hypothetical protein C0596_18035 [Marinilabiliales bacterium]|nr:MAG: hypothetical protein C0596_18035 [Marinilabiliales bacterium]